MISNSEIATILKQISEYLAMEDVAFKPQAYEKAALIIESLEKPVAELYYQNGLAALETLPGIGHSIAEKIEELIKTGRSRYYESLKKKIPVDLATLSRIEGLGPKSIKKLYQQLKIKNLADLEKAAKEGRISHLPGFGPKSEENILKGIEFLKQSSQRFELGFIMDIIEDIQNRLRQLKETEKIAIAGSVRRQKETVGDVDILIVSNQPKKIMDFFVNMPEVAHVFAYGLTKSAVRLKNGLEIDLRVVKTESFGAALNYFTGSKEHNIALREIAIKKGYKLNEYGLFKGNKQIAGRTEEEIYKALGMAYIEPEMRENRGEIQLAQKNQLPKLIGYDELLGDLQIQSNWTDGSNSIEELALAAIKRGLRYIAITDHTKHLAMTGGLDEKRLLQQWREIDKLNSRFRIKNSKFKILKSTECDILKDGSLDLPDAVLKQADLVGASIHSYFNLSEKEQTARLIKAMKNPYVDIIFHPTGRLINRRPPYQLDIDKIIETARQTRTALEINAYPNRLDLKDEYVRKCVDAGVKLAINSDAHAIEHLDFIKYGIAQARRGWAQKKDIINAWPLEKMLKLIKHNL